ncbi:MAG: DUF1559 domain-containing protein [Pirellulaceae bacterium]|nr:DUF1559 domain-containing protein [Planctomycetales bacterium]
MARRRVTGFTIVELLVVITIIAMLSAILLPAVNSAREAARRATCMTNIKNLAVAVNTYEARTNRFPGYRNALTVEGQPNPIDVSWVVALSPDFGEASIYDTYANGSPVIGYVDALVCASDSPERGDQVPPLSYVANAGMYIAGLSANDTQAQNPKQLRYQQNNNQANGIFLDSFISASIPSHVRPFNTTAFIDGNGRDGLSKTLLFSENLVQFSQVYTGLQATWAKPDDHKMDTVFLWSDMNKGGIPLGINNYRLQPNTIPPLRYPAPSSSHPSGVNVAFCDASTLFLTESIDDIVYFQLMTPSGKESNHSLPAFRESILNDLDYR